MNTSTALIQKHSFITETTFRLKVFLFTVQRLVKNSISQRIKRAKNEFQLTDAPVIASSESELWNADDNESNWILTAGKIENLRIAAQKLNGIEIKAGSTFSFWKHIGKPSRMRGFVVGREIREGCIVPTIAGGLCQLSNALYDAALNAGFEIIERHKHTQVIKGSLAEQGRDATVKWNYVDLRFRSAHDFKIVIDLNAEKMLLSFKSFHRSEPSKQNSASNQASKLNDCYSCGNTTCFKHPGQVALSKQKQITTFILDEKWPEYQQYVKAVAKPGDHFIVPFKANDRLKINRHAWDLSGRSHTGTIRFAALKRGLSLRIAAKQKSNIPSVYLRYDQQLITALKRNIPVESTHIVIVLNLLPFAWQQGILWGRTFEVLMTRLPMEILQQNLDKAHLIHQDSKTLNDFRADQTLIDLENIALTRATRIITPHQHIAGIFNNKSIKLNWAIPKLNRPSAEGDKILFPASALARKGAYEIRDLVKELGFSLVITGHATENDEFWKGIPHTFAGPDIFKNIKVVVLPAYVEHQPRLLLRALAMDIPVIATSACGLPPMQNLTIISEGDYQALKEAVEKCF